MRASSASLSFAPFFLVARRQRVVRLVPLPERRRVDHHTMAFFTIVLARASSLSHALYTMSMILASLLPHEKLPLVEAEGAELLVGRRARARAPGGKLVAALVDVVEYRVEDL